MHGKASSVCTVIFSTIVGFLLATGPPPEAASGGICTSPTECVFDGLRHCAVGNARLAIVGNDLEVSNIGSSGQDGYTVIMPPGLSGFRMRMPEMDPNQTPTGTHVQAVFRGTLNGVPDQFLSSVREEDTGSDVVTRWQFNPAFFTPSQFRAQCGSTLVHTEYVADPNLVESRASFFFGYWEWCSGGGYSYEGHIVITGG
jgi:hypothetical protein